MNRPRGGSQRGFVSFKTLMILIVLWAVITAGITFIPAYYDFRVLKNLADRVVGEFADLDLAEVNRRVNFEIDRGNLELEPEAFVLEPLRDGGYSVAIDYVVVFTLGVDEFNLIPPQTFHFTYQAATKGRG